MKFPGKSLFSSPKPPAPVQLEPLPPVPTPQSVDNSAAERARKEEERLSRKRRSGLGATRLTAPDLGDSGSSNLGSG